MGFPEEPEHEELVLAVKHAQHEDDEGVMVMTGRGTGRY
jgi:hypothetical protein